MPQRIAFVASQTEEAQTARVKLAAHYGDAPLDQADVIVALGGDGFMLRTLHRHMARSLPVYGMKLGTVGFLMNQYHLAELPERIARAQPTVLHPLLMEAATEAGSSATALAFNEVSLLRQTKQAAHLRVSLNGVVKIDELICDGILVSTPAGSSAYNLSAHGPILPLGSQLLALTPISPFRPRRWRGALLPDRARVTIRVLDAERRPVAAVADHAEVRSVREVEIGMDYTISMQMLFDPGHSLDERILREQFGY